LEQTSINWKSRKKEETIYNLIKRHTKK
jgi:hypothetical protein